MGDESSSKGMAAEGFFHRWSRLKSAGGDPASKPAKPVQRCASVTDTGKATAAPEKRLPSLDDVARLAADSDYSAFVAQGVDKTVQRLAMKKLFSDAHFNIMDGLDIYIADYNKADPVPAAMLASLRHAQQFLGRVPEVAEGGEDVSMPVEDAHESQCATPQQAHCSEQGEGGEGDQPPAGSAA